LELSSIEEIVECARNGKLFVLVDDENRENEGDLIFPAQLITPSIINFMAKYGRGLICLALTEERSKQLDLKPMDRRNTSKFDTAFTVSIEAKEGVTTGISAADRSRTIQTAIDNTRDKDDITTPGHIFPLVARNGGVLSRAGHTEAAIDIARLAGLNPSAVICEIMNDDGSMARMNDLKQFCKYHDLKLASIEDLIRWRVHKDPIVKKIFSDKLITDFAGEFNFFCYSNQVDKTEHFALVKGDISEEEDTLVRVQKINYVNDIFKGQLLNKKGNYSSVERAMIEINKKEKGVLVIIKDNKSEFNMARLDLKNTAEFREYGVGAQILRDLGVRKMLLLTNSKQEIIGLDGFDLKIVGKISL
jgi:3,4-dihydroxy 2-butanone 4-phosphate synthase/GTP cyclohydrolase II